MDKDNDARMKYTQARATFQNLRRKHDNFANIRLNNKLMHSTISDRNMMYSTLRRIRGEHSKPVNNLLETPVGDYHVQMYSRLLLQMQSTG